MKSMRILGLALVAVFAVVAFTATSAMANPTWKACVKAEPKNTGAFSDKLCSISAPGTGKYNLVEGVGKGKKFKGKALGVSILHNVIPGKGDIKVECAKSKDEGQVANVGGVGKEFGVKAVFSKCKSLGSPCKTEGGKKETITTETLAGNLGWLDKSKNEAGASLFNEANPGPGFEAQFECEGLAKVRVHGGVIGGITPVGVVSKVAFAKFTVGEFLGEPAPGYKPLTNPPAFEEEAVGVLLTELNGPETGNTWQPEGGLPSGQEGEVENKGESLEIS
jgi:hypothetical protein